MASNAVKGKVAVLTGGNRGIGKATVLALAQRGTSTIFTYNSHPEEAEAVVASVASLNTGAKAHAIKLDVSSTSGFDAFVASTLDVLKAWNRSDDKIDVLIPSAGHGPAAPIAQMSEADVDLAFAVHYKQPFFLVQKFLPHLRDNGARVITISTGLSRFTSNPFAAYASMKGGVEVFTKYLAQEVGTRGIRSICVRPGALATDFGNGIVRDNEMANKAVASVIPLGRPGTAEEVGNVIASLTGDEFGWVNGTTIEVSGGQAI